MPSNVGKRKERSTHSKDSSLVPLVLISFTIVHGQDTQGPITIKLLTETFKVKLCVLATEMMVLGPN